MGRKREQSPRQILFVDSCGQEGDGTRGRAVGTAVGRHLCSGATGLTNGERRCAGQEDFVCAFVRLSGGAGSKRRLTRNSATTSSVRSTNSSRAGWIRPRLATRRCETWAVSSGVK